MSTILHSQLHTTMPPAMPAAGSSTRVIVRSTAILLVALTLTAGVLLALASLVDSLA